MDPAEKLADTIRSRIVFSALPDGMASRIREEITLSKRRRLLARDRLIFVRHVLQAWGRKTRRGACRPM